MTQFLKDVTEYRTLLVWIRLSSKFMVFFNLIILRSVIL